MGHLDGQAAVVTGAIAVNGIAPGLVLSNPTTQAQWDSYGAGGHSLF
jgi:hypothetical protein